MDVNENQADWVRLLAEKTDARGRASLFLKELCRQRAKAAFLLWHDEPSRRPWLCEGLTPARLRSLRDWGLSFVPAAGNETWTELEAPFLVSGETLLFLAGERDASPALGLGLVMEESFDRELLMREQPSLRLILAALAAEKDRESRADLAQERLKRRLFAAERRCRAEADLLLMGESRSVRELRTTLTDLSLSESPVWIFGEPGSWLDAVVFTLHGMREDSEAPLIRLADLERGSESLVLTELFGDEHEDGYEGGEGRPGLLELADGGTLWLDRPERWPDAIHQRLAHALRRQHTRRLGARQERGFRVRLMATSSQSPAFWRERGFWPDVWGNLFGDSLLRVPPLRERIEDLDILVRHFVTIRPSLGLSLEKSDDSVDLPLTAPFGVSWSAEALEVLRRHAWPENLDELKRVCDQAALSARTCATENEVTILPHHLDGLPVRSRELEASFVPKEGTFKQAVDAFRRRLIHHVVTRHEGNWARAARELGMDRGNLHRLAQRLGLSD